MKYTDVESKIPNTIMKKLTNADGVEVCFEITPVDGYETHHHARCYEDENMETGEKTFVHGYSVAPCTVPLDYDFDNTKEVDGHIAYGFLEIFARPESEVPEKQIFGGGNNDHEVRSDVE